MHPSSTTHKLTELNYGYHVLNRAVELWGEAGPDQRRLPEGVLAKRLANLCLMHGRSHLFRGNPGIAAKAFRDSLRHSGFRWKTCLYYTLALLKAGYNVSKKIFNTGIEKKSDILILLILLSTLLKST
jgi:hypothetical protein